MLGPFKGYLNVLVCGKVINKKILDISGFLLWNLASTFLFSNVVGRPI